MIVENYVRIHQGQCNTVPAVITTSNNVDTCFKECESNPNIGFFAFNPINQGCYCYPTADGCPDHTLMDYSAYKIIKGN